MLPLLLDGEPVFERYDWIVLPGIREAVAQKAPQIQAWAFRDGKPVSFTLTLGDLTDDEREIILAGCLINYYAK